MHRNSQLLFLRYAVPYFKSGMSVLEIGPDGAPSSLRKIVGNLDLRWQGLDLAARPGVDVVAEDEYHFPIPDNSFDIILSANVIEHVRMTWRWITELTRVCKPGGHVITINPVNWPYHEAPIDCWRIYPEGMKALYSHAGLAVKECQCRRLELSTLALARQGRPYRSMFLECVRRVFAYRRPFLLASDTIGIGQK